MNPGSLSKTFAIVAVAVAACAPLAAGAQTVWRLASGYSENAFQTLNLKQFAHDVSVATGGRLTMDVHANNTLYKLGEIPSRVESGAIPAGETIMSNLAAEIPVAGADSVPFIVGSYDDARRLWKAQRPVLDAELAHKGLIGLYAVAWPPQGLYAAKAIKVSSDLKGSRMRTYNAATQRIAEQLGARPVAVMMTDLAQALAAGRVESMITSGATGIDSHAWEQLKYFYDIHAWYPKNIVLVNAAAYAALAPRDQEGLRSAAAAAEARGWQMSQAAEAASLAELAAHGMHLDTVDFEFRNEMRRYGERFAVEWVRATGQGASAILIPYYVTAAAR
ncbi:MAG: TRAP transporter substrate-binding protein [Betaproteobacteria bacterium]